jgi:urea transporter
MFLTTKYTNHPKKESYFTFYFVLFTWFVVRLTGTVLTIDQGQGTDRNPLRFDKGLEISDSDGGYHCSISDSAA